MLSVDHVVDDTKCARARRGEVDDENEQCHGPSRYDCAGGAEGGQGAGGWT